MKGGHPDKKLFDLGLAVGAATLLPGQRRSCEEIAAFCWAAGAPVSRERIRQIEAKALRKLRHLANIKKLA